MYAEYFQFESMPFSNTADPRFFFRTAEHEEALAALVYGVTQRRGMTLVSGQPGSGKTLLGQMLLRSLHGSTDAAMIVHAPESGQDLLLSICNALGIRCRSTMTSGELVERLRAHLNARADEDRCVVVIVDEAQNIQPDVLEHLRMLGNLERDSVKLLQIVLLGQPEFLGTLQQARFDQLRQRIYCTCQLRPLARDQVRSYIRHRLKVAGGKDLELFDDEACDLIHERSTGLPRIVNQIADNALLAAYSASCNKVTRETVAGCLTDMMPIPAPRTEEQPREAVPTPAVPIQPLPSPAIEAATRDAERSAVALNAALQAGAESAGRLMEASRTAAQHAATLAELLSRSEAATTALRDAQNSTVVLSGKASARVEQLSQLLGDAAAACDRLQLQRKDAAVSSEQVAAGVSQIRDSREQLARLASEIGNSVGLAAAQTQQLLEQVTAGQAALSEEKRSAGRIRDELLSTIARAEEARGSVESTASTATTYRQDMEALFERGRKQAQEAQASLCDVERAADRLTQLLQETANAETSCHDQVRRLSQAVLEAAEGIVQLESSIRSAAQAREMADASAVLAGTQAGELNALSSRLEQQARQIEERTAAATACHVSLSDTLAALEAQNTAATGTLEQSRRVLEAARGSTEAVAGAEQRLGGLLEHASAQGVTWDARLARTAEHEQRAAHLLTRMDAAIREGTELSEKQAAIEALARRAEQSLADADCAIESRLEEAAQRVAILEEQARTAEARVAEAEQRSAAVAAEVECMFGRWSEQTEGLRSLIASADERNEKLSKALHTASRAEAAAHEQARHAVQRTAQAAEQVELLDAAASRADGVRQAVETSIAPLLDRGQRLTDRLDHHGRTLDELLQRAAGCEERLTQANALACERTAEAQVSAERCSREVENARAAGCDVNELVVRLRGLVDDAVRAEVAGRSRLRESTEAVARAMQLVEEIEASSRVAEQARTELAGAGATALQQKALCDSSAAEAEQGRLALERTVAAAEEQRSVLAEAVQAATERTCAVEETLRHCGERADLAREAAEVLSRSVQDADRAVADCAAAQRDTRETLSLLGTRTEAALRIAEQARGELASAGATALQQKELCDSSALQAEQGRVALERTVAAAEEQRSLLADAVQAATERTCAVEETLRHCGEQADLAREAAEVLSRSVQDADRAVADCATAQRDTREALSLLAARTEAASQIAEQARNELASAGATALQQKELCDSSALQAEQGRVALERTVAVAEEQRSALAETVQAATERTCAVEETLRLCGEQADLAREATEVLSRSVQDANRAVADCATAQRDTRESLSLLAARTEAAAESISEVDAAVQRVEQVHQSLRSGTVAAAAEAGRHREELTQVVERATQTHAELVAGASSAATMVDSLAARLESQAASFASQLHAARELADELRQAHEAIRGELGPDLLGAVDARALHLQKLLKRATRQSQVFSQSIEALATARDEIRTQADDAARVQDVLAESIASAGRSAGELAGAVEQAQQQVNALAGEVRAARNASFVLSRARQEVEFAEASCQRRSQQMTSSIDQMEQRCTRIEGMLVRGGSAEGRARQEARSKAAAAIEVAERSVEAVRCVRSEALADVTAVE